MCRGLFTGALVLLMGTVSLASASAQDEVQAAVKKLADSGDFSWTSSVSTASGMAPGLSEGKSSKDGVAHVTMSIRDRTGEFYVKGTTGAVKTDDGWKSLAEAATIADGDEATFTTYLALRAQNFRGPSVAAQDLLLKAKDLHGSFDDAYIGALPAETVKELVLATFGQRPGQDANAPEIVGAKGTVKFWLKEGALFKFQYILQGTVTINGEEHDIGRTTTVLIKDVGATHFTVPPAAKEKMK